MKKKLLLLAGLSTLAWLSVLSIWFFIPPKMLGFGTVLLMLSLLFLALFGVFTIMGFYGRLIYTKNESYFHNFKTSCRQGTLLSLYCCLLLFFSFLRIATVAIDAMLFLVFVFIELFLRGE